jgi:hypothetical protein
MSLHFTCRLWLHLLLLIGSTACGEVISSEIGGIITMNESEVAAERMPAPVLVLRYTSDIYNANNFWHEVFGVLVPTIIALLDNRVCDCVLQQSPCVCSPVELVVPKLFPLRHALEEQLAFFRLDGIVKLVYVPSYGAIPIVGLNPCDKGIAKFCKPQPHSELSCFDTCANDGRLAKARNFFAQMLSLNLDLNDKNVKKDRYVLFIQRSCTTTMAAAVQHPHHGLCFNVTETKFKSIVKELLKYNITAVSADFSGMPFADQFALISDAFAVVAPHGPSLTHLLWAKPDIEAFEITPYAMDNVGRTLPMRLAKALDMYFSRVPAFSSRVDEARFNIPSERISSWGDTVPASFCSWGCYEADELAALIARRISKPRLPSNGQWPHAIPARSKDHMELGFLHLPKTGGTAIKDHLLVNREECNSLVFTFSHDETERMWQSAGFHTVVVLRDPAERFRSAFDYAAWGSDK